MTIIPGRKPLERLIGTPGLACYISSPVPVRLTILPLGVLDADRFIEVAFNPELDTYFGVRNVKRGVEPHGELRNKLRDLLARYIPTDP